MSRHDVGMRTREAHVEPPAGGSVVEQELHQQGAERQVPAALAPAAPGPAATPPSAKALARAGIAGWAARLGTPGPESPRSRRWAHLGAVAAIAALVLYLCWRTLFTLPSDEGDLTVAWILVTFEALPLTGLVLKAWAVWNIDSRPPAPVTEAPYGMRAAVP